MIDPLGPDYSSETLELRGGEIATLVSLPAKQDVPAQGAFLYLHGFVDYFFQDHLARHITNLGWAFYAVDLRRYGRSLRPGMEPWYTDDLTEYYEELDACIARIRADGHERVVMMGHSTGGLIASIWAHDRRMQHPIDGLILNSPWLDAKEPWLLRTLGTWVARAIGKVRPLSVYPQKLDSVYSQSIHRSAKGEWDFNPRWKPLTPQPVKFGFVAAVRREHARLHKGLDVNVPVLQLRSARSRLDLKGWEEEAQQSDTVLDVEQMRAWLPSIGEDTTDVALDGAMHEVLLSAPPVRQRAFQEIDGFLGRIATAG